MRQGILTILIMLLAAPTLTSADQEAEASKKTIAIEMSGHSDQESLARILSEAGVELDGETLQALQGSGAKIKIIKHSPNGDNDANTSTTKKIFVTRSKDHDQPLAASNEPLNIDQLDIEVIATGDDDFHFISGLGASSGHAERILIDKLHEAPGRGSEDWHWIESSSDEHPRQKLGSDAAQCIIKNLTKATHPGAVKLLREACLSLYEE